MDWLSVLLDFLGVFVLGSRGVILIRFRMLLGLADVGWSRDIGKSTNGFNRDSIYVFRHIPLLREVFQNKADSIATMKVSHFSNTHIFI